MHMQIFPLKKRAAYPSKPPRCGTRTSQITRPTLAITALGVITFAALFFVGEVKGQQYIDDTGIVQISTFVILTAASLYSACLAVRHADNRVTLGLLAYILAIYAAREFDLHRPKFLAEHFTKWQFYVMPEVAWWQKLLFGSIILTIIAAIGGFLIRMAAGTVQDLKRRETWALFAVIWFFTLLGSQIADRTWLNRTFGGRAFEETLETVAAIFALLVVHHLPRTRFSTDQLPAHIPQQYEDPHG